METAQYNQAIADAMGRMGEPSPVTYPTKKRNVVSFKGENMYMGLKLVSEYDKEKGEYLPPVPRMTFTVDGKYVRIPMDYHWLKRFATFISDLADIIKDVDVRYTGDGVNVGKEEAMRLLDEFRRKHCVQT